MARTLSCLNCTNTFTPTHSQQVYCEACRPAMEAKGRHEWHQDNPTKNAEYLRKSREKKKAEAAMVQCPGCGGKGTLKKITGREKGLFGRVIYEEQQCTQCGGRGKVSQ